MQLNILSFEAIRAEMEKNIEGDEQLDYLDETSKRQEKFTAVSLDHRSLTIRHAVCFNGHGPVDRANSSVRLQCLQRSLGSES